MDEHKPDVELLDYVMEEYELGLVEIWQSSKNKYWIIAYTHLPKKSTEKIHKLLKGDKLHLDCSIKDKEFILRITKKNKNYPHLQQIIMNPEHDWCYRCRETLHILMGIK